MCRCKCEEPKLKPWWRKDRRRIQRQTALRAAEHLREVMRGYEAMNRFNHYMGNHFGGCAVIAHAHDVCRHRDVKIHAIPGHNDVVGISDGTDAWIAPLTAGMYFHTVEGADLVKQFEALAAGKPLPPLGLASKRARSPSVDDEPQPRTRTRAESSDDDEPQPRKVTRRAAFS